LTDHDRSRHSGRAKKLASRWKLGRPALAIGAMLAGATFGALLVLRVDAAAGLGLAVGILVVVCGLALVAEEAEEP
jgi:hypothetical protein